MLKLDYKLAAAGLLIIASIPAWSTCYIRTSSVLKTQQVNSPPTDVRRMVVPDKRGQKCVVSYRIHVGDSWRDAEGEAVAKTEEQACNLALDASRGYLLTETNPKSIKSETQMVCSDRPEIRVRPVRIGDTVWESETDFVPAKDLYFDYGRSRCRMFIERLIQNRDMSVYEGVICKNGHDDSAKWIVVDKY